MKDVDEIIKYLDEINERCESYINIKVESNSYCKKVLNDTKYEFNKLNEDFVKNFNEYIKINFDVVKNDIKEKLSFLHKIINDNVISNDSNFIDNISNKNNNEELNKILSEQINKLNSLINDLNSDDLNSKMMNNKIAYLNGKFVLVNNVGSISYNASVNCNESIFDKNIILSCLDNNKIVEIFKTEKNIYSLIDLIEKNFLKDCNIEKFNAELKLELEKYKQKVEGARLEIQTRECNEKFLGKDICYKDKDFFESINLNKNIDDPFSDYDPNIFKDEMIIGQINHLCINNSNYMNEIKRSPIWSHYLDSDGYFKFPLNISLRNKGNFLISTYQKNNYGNKLKKFVNQLIIQFLLSFPASRIHFKLVDINNKMGFSNFSILRKINDNILLDGIVRDEKELEVAIDQIKKIKFNQEDKLGAEGIKSFYDYNKKYASAPLDVYLLVLIDFPSGIDLNLANKIKDIMHNGNNDGVFTILVENNYHKSKFNFSENEYRLFNDYIKNISYCFYGNENNVCYGTRDNSYNKIKLLDNINITYLNIIVEKLKKEVEESISKSIPLLDMFDYIDKTPQKNISSEMEIPFGQSGGDIQTLKLTNQSGPHAALIGTSGSGKSVLFHTLILDACYKYSPEELNFYLLDFKGGVEFKYYENNKLPHIKVIGLTNDLNDGLAILTSINKEITRRKKLFNEIGVSNIESYYRAGKIIPRLFVIIDEIQEILVRDEKIGEKALDILSEILAIGRSFGINVLWGSQSVPHISGIQPKIMQNITNRICLKVANSDYAMNFFGDSKLLKAVDNLNRPGIIGLGVIKDERTGSSVKEFRVAYSEEGEKRKTYLNKILDKWSNIECKDDLFVIGNELIPDVLKDEFYSQDFLQVEKSSKSFETYKLCLGSDYISGTSYSIEIFNTKERENLITIGTDIDLLRDIMGYSLLSVILNRFIDSDYLNKNKIYYANKEGVNPKYINTLYNYLPKMLKDDIEIVRSDDKFVNCIKDLYYVYLQRKNSFDNGEIPEDYSSIYLFIHSMQNFNDLLEEDRNLDDMSLGEDFSFNSIKFNDAFKILLKKGSQFGIHFIISINDIESIREVRDELKQFNYKIATIGSNPSSFIDLPFSQIPSIINNRVGLFYNKKTIEKIRLYRFDEKDEKCKQWIENLIHNIRDK